MLNGCSKSNTKLTTLSDKLKARLVAKGFNQEAGVDYTETYSLVAKPTVARLILTLATIKNWSVHQLDVCIFEWSVS